MTLNGNNHERQVQPRVAFITLGCKVNSAETEGMKSLFLEAGYIAVDPDLPADVCVINTCTVTGTGERKSRQMIRRVRNRNPDAIVVATGCYVQVSPEEAAALAGVDLVLGNNRKHQIVSLVETLRKTSTPVAGARVEVIPRQQMTDYEPLPVSGQGGHTRAFLKIQDGCDRFCSYCIIPYARGPVRSRPAPDALEEVRRLVAEGFSEFVLTGIHLASYRDGTGKPSLLPLLREMDGVGGVRRIRLGSMEPFTLTPAFLDELTGIRALCPHFHISLQSGSAGVLARMNRRYSPEQYLQMLRELRARFTDLSVTTDVMVGFPGETEDEFEETLAFCSKAGFSGMHVFPYSPRRGTPAASFPDQISGTVREVRAARMGELSAALQREFADAHVGREMEVLFEQEAPGLPGFREGLTANYLTVAVPGSEALDRRYAGVRLERVEGNRLLGRLCQQGADCGEACGQARWTRVKASS